MMPTYILLFIIYIVLIYFLYKISYIKSSLNHITKIQFQKYYSESKKNNAYLPDFFRQPQKYLIVLQTLKYLLSFFIPALPLFTLILLKNTLFVLNERILFIFFYILSFIFTEAILVLFDIISRYKARLYNEEKINKYIKFLNFIINNLKTILSIYHSIIKKVSIWMNCSLTEKSILVTEDDIRKMVELGRDEGIFKENEVQIIDKIFKFDDLKVKDIMLPAIDMDCIDADDTKENIINFIISTKHSRIPVYKNNIDNLIGILYVKDLFEKIYKKENWNVQAIVRPAVFIPEVKMVNQLLKQFQKEKVHIGIVVDEFGSVAGLITIEDILEELVGDIEDEYDVDEGMIKLLNDNSYLIDAKISLNDLNEELNLDLDGNKFESLGGFVISIFGDIPPINEKIIYNNCLFEIVYSDNRKITKIRLKIIK